jgi:hypothetical protein
VIELLASVMMVAAGAVGLTTVLRSIVPARWVEGTRPWSCDLCMSWWSSIACIAVALVVGYGTVREALVVLLPSFAFAFFVQQRLHPEPQGAAPVPEIDLPIVEE